MDVEVIDEELAELDPALVLNFDVELAFGTSDADAVTDALADAGATARDRVICSNRDSGSESRHSELLCTGRWGSGEVVYDVERTSSDRVSGGHQR